MFRKKRFRQSGFRGPYLLHIGLISLSVDDRRKSSHQKAALFIFDIFPNCATRVVKEVRMFWYGWRTKFSVFLQPVIR